MGNDKFENAFEIDDEIIGILNEIEKKLNEWGCEFNKSCECDERFGFNAVITVFNPIIDRNLSIDITKSEDYSEISMYFADWHAHCSFDDISGVSDTIRDLITNKFGCFQVYLGKEHRRSFGSGISRHKSENVPTAECFGLQSDYNEHWAKNGAEMQIKFWDPKYDKIYTIEKR